jgi:DNA (cytosine-5)-methyltransferase 1
VIDLFAGPGGLNEGFAQVAAADGSPAFSILDSYEVTSEACDTLHLRAFYRRLLRNHDESALKRYDAFARGEITLERMHASPTLQSLWEETQVDPVRLGVETRDQSDEQVIASLRAHRARGGENADNLVVIGGPPCQAYSLAGRSRRAHDETFAEDEKHHLYREYLHFIARHRPAIFVMENVQGLLTARSVSIEDGRKSFSTTGDRIVRQIFDDLRHPADDLEYVLRPLVDTGADDPDAREFIVNMADHGVPEARRRLIVLGIRSDLAESLTEKGLLHESLPTFKRRTVREAFRGLPNLRSGISRGLDDWEDWQALRKQGRAAYQTFRESIDAPVSLPEVHIEDDPGRGRRSHAMSEVQWPFDGELRSRQLGAVIQHETRAHMPSDLVRYEFYALDALHRQGATLKVGDLPPELLPDHRNVTEATDRSSLPFADRFRVQRWSRPSSTVTSHIAKDGHAFIHPDPDQMRSLTVREAARLQTFPDDFVFCGNRTQQYHQVGNAVPPLMAKRIGELVLKLLRV